MTVHVTNRRRSRWLVVVAAIFAVLVVLAGIVAIVAFTWLDVSLNDGVGDKSFAPASAGEVRGAYKVGVGDLTLDLSRVSAAREVEVDAHVGIGKLRVIVPNDASVVVDAHVKAGSISALGQDDDGRNARVVVGNGKLHLKARVGGGRIEVVRG